VRDEDAPLVCGPLQNGGIIRTREAQVLNVHDIQLRISAKEPSDDVSIEVLVRRKPQHRRAFLLAPGYQSLPYAGRRKPPLNFLSNSRSLFMACLKVGGNRALVAQVVSDHGVHVR